MELSVMSTELKILLTQKKLFFKLPINKSMLLLTDNSLSGLHQSFAVSGGYDSFKGGMPMKKILCLCLVLSLLVACSSEKDAKPNPAATSATETAAAPAAPEPITSLSGEYILTETNANQEKPAGQEFRCVTTHTYKLMFMNYNRVQYTAKSEQTIDPPAEGMMCQSKWYNVDVTGNYEIKDSLFVTLTFSPSDGKLPWVHKNIMSLKLKDENTLEIFANGSEFRKQ